MDAGRLDRRLRFEKRQEVSDGAGNTTGAWTPQFTMAAGRKWLNGGEGVLASRLENRQPVILTIRNCSQARQITHEWRAIDDRDGRVYALRETPREADDRSTLEALAECGVAA